MSLNLNIDYVIRKRNGWYAVVNRNGFKLIRGPFRWQWVANIAMWV